MRPDLTNEVQISWIEWIQSTKALRTPILTDIELADPFLKVLSLKAFERKFYI